MGKFRVRAFKVRIHPSKVGMDGGFGVKSLKRAMWMHYSTHVMSQICRCLKRDGEDLIMRSM